MAAGPARTSRSSHRLGGLEKAHHRTKGRVVSNSSFPGCSNYLFHVNVRNTAPIGTCNGKGSTQKNTKEAYLRDGALHVGRGRIGRYGSRGKSRECNWKSSRRTCRCPHWHSSAGPIYPGEHGAGVASWCLELRMKLSLSTEMRGILYGGPESGKMLGCSRR